MLDKLKQVATSAWEKANEPITMSKVGTSKMVRLGLMGTFALATPLMATNAIAQTDYDKIRQSATEMGNVVAYFTELQDLKEKTDERSIKRIKEILAQLKRIAEKSKYIKPNDKTKILKAIELYNCVIEGGKCSGSVRLHTSITAPPAEKERVGPTQKQYSLRLIEYIGKYMDTNITEAERENLRPWIFRYVKKLDLSDTLGVTSATDLTINNDMLKKVEDAAEKDGYITASDRKTAASATPEEDAEKPKSDLQLPQELSALGIKAVTVGDDKAEIRFPYTKPDGSSLDLPYGETTAQSFDWNGVQVLDIRIASEPPQHYVFHAESGTLYIYDGETFKSQITLTPHK